MNLRCRHSCAESVALATRRCQQAGNASHENDIEGLMSDWTSLWRCSSARARARVIAFVILSRWEDATVFNFRSERPWTIAVELRLLTALLHFRPTPSRNRSIPRRRCGRLENIDESSWVREMGRNSGYPGTRRSYGRGWSNSSGEHFDPRGGR